MEEKEIRQETKRGRRNILMAVDASEHSLEAVRYAGRILPREGTRITLFHVLSTVPECFLDLSIPCREHQMVGADAWKVRQTRMAQDFMERAKELLVSLQHPEDAMSVVIEDRDKGIARDIAREAQRGYDALVMGRKGMGEVADLILGSTAHKLVSHLSETTVWVVGGQPNPDKILIAMDSSEGARRALEYVGSIFGRAHPEILLLHVTRGMGLSQPDLQEDRLAADWLEQAKEDLKKAEIAMTSIFEYCIGHLKQRGADVSRIKTKIIPGVYSRAAAIFGESREEGYGTIVVGRRGLSRVEDFFMGRVSNKVLQLAQEMAVWVVH